MTKPDVGQDGLDDGTDSTVSNDSDTNSNSSGGSTGFGTRRTPLAEKEVWFKTYWRPAAAWLYLFINLFDFVIAPVTMPIMSKYMGTSYTAWQSLTLSNGGLFHLAFGAIIGVTAWGRTRERQAGLID